MHTMKTKKDTMLHRHRRWVLPVGVLLLVVSMACRFNVREIGFAEIVPNPYIFYYYHNDAAAAGQFKKQADKVFAFSNVKVKTIAITDKDNPEINYLKEKKGRQLPAAVLLAPDGHTVEYAVPAEKDKRQSMLRDIVSSPFRSSIKSMLVHKYAVVLLLDGPNAAQNELAAKLATEDIQELEKIMPRMPKLIEEGPELVRLSREEMAREESLLWSLGLRAEEVHTPTAVILYGRGRIMGDVIAFKDIQDKVIFKLLNIIGADCECGLDRKWMLGKLIPMTWDEHLRTELFGLLKFDVENPMILAEMSQIISIESTKSGNGVDDLELFQPQEYSLSDESLNAAIPDVQHVSPRAVPYEQEEVGYGDKLVSATVYIVAGVVLLVVLCVIFLFIRKKRQAF